MSTDSTPGGSAGSGDATGSGSADGFVATGEADARGAADAFGGAPAAAFTQAALSTLRTALGLYGVLALIIGVLILVWPGKTAVVVTAIIAIYAILGGIVYAAVGVFTKIESGWARVGHVVLGILYVLAGIIALANLGLTTVTLAAFIGILIGIMWIVEGAVSLTTVGASKRKGLTIFFAIISILAGLVLLFSPLFAIVALWWMVGIMLVVMGITQIVRAITITKIGDVRP